MRNYGLEANYIARGTGLNGKLSELNAIIGIRNLERLDAILNERRKKAQYYQEQLQSRTSFRPIPPRSNVQHTYKDFTVFVPDQLFGRRDEIMRFLESRNVEVRSYFDPPVHEQPYFQDFNDRHLPNTEKLARAVITLPFYTTISEDDMDYVIDSLVVAEKALS
jgi:dTDP-4-amino-4,6-dideoxygalactose transaminase